MKARNHMSKKNTVLITESSNKIEEILCKAIFDDFTTQLAKEKEAVLDICRENETIILSSACPDVCTYIYKHYLEGKCSLHLLKPIDIDEAGLDDESIFRFTLFNLELFRKKSFRAKATFIAKSTISDIQKDNYKDIFDLDSMNKAPLLYINLYRVIAFENQTALTRIFDLLKNFNKDTQSSFLDSFLPFIIHTDSLDSCCRTLITYYRQINYTNNEHKGFIFSFLNKIYKKTDDSSIQKIDQAMLPIFSYCLSEDIVGSKIELLESYLKPFPPVTKNLSIIGIVIYSKVFRNEKYYNSFFDKIVEPSSNLELYWKNTLFKVEKLLDNGITTSIPSLEIQKGVDQYLGNTQNSTTPIDTSPMFDLLVNLK